MGQYAEIAESYGSEKRTKHPTRQMVYVRWIELCRKLSGGLNGKKVLDIGCGVGNSSELLAETKAWVAGLEPESELLKIAKRKTCENKSGIVYIKGKLPYEMPMSIRKETFNLVTGVFLLHYAPNREELFSMVAEIFRLLKPGCHFVGINSDPGHPITELNLSPELIQHKTRWIGIPWVEGSKIEADLVGVENGLIQIFWWDRETYEEAFKQAGFRDIAWHKFQYLEHESPAEWQSIEEDISLIMLPARKPPVA